MISFLLQVTRATIRGGVTHLEIVMSELIELGYVVKETKNSNVPPDDDLDFPTNLGNSVY